MKDWLKKIIVPGTLAVLGYLIVATFLGSLCPFRQMTGFSCPGCGMTRACRAFLTGDIRGAFYYHPLFPLLLPGAVMILMEDKIPRKVYNISLFFIACSFVAVYIIRMANGSPVMNRDFHNGLLWKIYVLIRQLLQTVT